MNLSGRVSCVALGLIAFFCCDLSDLRAKDDLPARLPNGLTSIDLSSASGWRAYFNSDGSGGLCFEASSLDSAIAPGKSFDFRKIYRLLEPHLTAKMPADPACAMVGFSYGKEARKTGILFWTRDQSIIRDLVTEARRKSVPFDSSRYEQCLREHPLFQPK